jgi:hypothetical protein
MSRESSRHHISSSAAALLNWDRHIEACDSIDLPLVLKSRTKEAIAYLRQEFGADFLQVCYRTRHPFLDMVMNQAPWTREWLVWLADASRAVKACKGSKRLVRNLRKRERYAEALTFLELASSFLSVGFACEIEPLCTVGGVTKRPDLVFTDPESGERLYAEITACQPSDEVRKANRTRQVIDDALRPNSWGIRFCGSIRRILDEAELIDAVAAIQATIRVVVENGGRHEVPLADVNIAVVRVGDEKLLEEWAAHNHQSVDCLLGPEYKRYELVRSVRSARREQDQLPPEVPGIVVVWNALALLLEVRDVQSSLFEMKTRWAAYSHVFALIIVGQWLGAVEPDVQRFGRNSFIAKKRFALLQECALILRNDGFTLRASRSFQERIARALGDTAPSMGAP